MATEEEPQMNPVPWEDPKKERTGELGNPGKFDQLGKEAQAVLQVDIFDGVRFDLNKMVSPVFYVGHHMTMGGSVSTGSYGFSANYVPNNDNLIGGRIDPQGNLTARVIRQLMPGLSTKIEAQIPPQPNPMALAVDMDYAGKTFQAGAKWSNEGIVTGAFTQAITPNLSAGVEAFHHPRMSALQLAARYETDRWVGHGMLMPSHGWALSYMRKASARVGLATSLHYNMINHDTTVEAAYSFNLRQANVKARVDSNGIIGCVVEEKVAQGFMLQLSGQLDHAKQDYKFGFGVNIG